MLCELVEREAEELPANVLIGSTCTEDTHDALLSYADLLQLVLALAGRSVPLDLFIESKSSVWMTPNIPPSEGKGPSREEAAGCHRRAANARVPSLLPAAAAAAAAAIRPAAALAEPDKGLASLAPTPGAARLGKLRTFT